MSTGMAHIGIDRCNASIMVEKYNVARILPATEVTKYCFMRHPIYRVTDSFIDIKTVTN
jgi:hypothetical protein